MVESGAMFARHSFAGNPKGKVYWHDTHTDDGLQEKNFVCHQDDRRAAETFQRRLQTTWMTMAQVLYIFSTDALK
jgi:hypothetical protein